MRADVSIGVLSWISPPMAVRLMFRHRVYAIEWLTEDVGELWTAEAPENYRQHLPRSPRGYMRQLITLYGSPMSLYTGRVRSYFIKAGVPFREVAPVSDHYEDVVLPKAGGRRSMPTVELPDGQVIRDSVAIVDHFEAELGSPFTPTTPRQQTVSLLFDLIGAEGLLRPALHYRWRFPENEALVHHHFAEITPRNAPWQFTLQGRIERMQQACIDLGVPVDRVELVESLYLGLLRKLDTHFANYPYLLGSKPCIGDFGLIAPMYAHLGRDPKPLSLMHEHGIHVLRWVERMNRPDHDLGAAHDTHEAFLSNDEIPETLQDVLRHIALDLVPETRAACDEVNKWIDAQSELKAGTTAERSVGDMATFQVEGTSMTAFVQPYRFYLLKRLQNLVADCSAASEQIVQLMTSVNMAELLGMKLTRDIGRAGNLEVWQ